MENPPPADEVYEALADAFWDWYRRKQEAKAKESAFSDDISLDNRDGGGILLGQGEHTRGSDDGSPQGIPDGQRGRGADGA